MKGMDHIYVRYLPSVMLRILIGGSAVSVALADDGGICATAHSVHFPVGVIVVYDMEKPPSAPRHPLNQLLTKMVERKCDLQYCISRVSVTCAKQHGLHARIYEILEENCWENQNK